TGSALGASRAAAAVRAVSSPTREIFLLSGVPGGSVTEPGRGAGGPPDRLVAPSAAGAGPGAGVRRPAPLAAGRVVRRAPQPGQTTDPPGSGGAVMAVRHRGHCMSP